MEAIVRLGLRQLCDSYLHYITYIAKAKVFVVFQSNLPLHPTERVPQFLVECVFRIESMISTVGIYRVNGDAAAVQKIRFSNLF